MSYVLKAKSKSEGDVYYMNIIMITEDLDCAEHFKTKEEAEAKKNYFACMFHYEQPEITVEEIK